MSQNPLRKPRIALAHSYFLRNDPKQWERMRPYPPLATIIAAAVLRDRGYDIVLFDAMLAHDRSEFGAFLDRTGPDVVAIVEDNFNYLTKMCTLRMREDTLAMVGAAVKRGSRVVINGADAIDHPGTYLDAGASVVVLGEPEYALVEVIAAWENESDPRSVAGICGQNGDERYTTHVRTPIRELDELPEPAWDLIVNDEYRKRWVERYGRVSWNMVTSRGCPYRCNWCAKPVFGSLYRQHSPARVARDMKHLKDTVDPDHVWFADDIFGLTEDWLERFGEEVVRLDAAIPFMMQSRVNLMKKSAVAALAAAGAEEVWLGVESGAQHILDSMEKGSTVEQARAATRALKAAGIKAGWFIQLGYTGEEWEDILITRNLIREERPDAIGVSVAYPLPGTSFYESVAREMGTKSNWDDSDDLAMMFAGTFDTDFYRDVRSLLHLEVDETMPDRRKLDERWRGLEARAARQAGKSAAASI